jgi:hypothetical protein
VVNCAGVIVDSCFGIPINTGDFTLVKEEASEKLVVSRIVEIIHKLVTVIKMGKETSKTLTELAVNPFPTLVKEPLRGWTPISEDHFRMNEEVYQSKWLIVVPASRIKSIAMVKKYDILKGESVYIFWNEKYLCYSVP